MKKPFVYICLSIDTEGPLYEDIVATFQRLESILEVKIPLKPSKANLEKLRAGKVDFLTTEQVEKVRIITDPHLLQYKSTWSEIDDMLYRIMSKEYRAKYAGRHGEGGLVFNWHVMDHVGYDTNPRHRDIGYLNVFDHYQRIMDEADSTNIDDIQWHVHAMHFKKQANLTAYCYENCYDLIHQMLCRRIIDRNFFPLVNRPGFHTERPDINWFLEQWMPFDVANQSVDNDDYTANGVAGDWRGAPKDWTIYHPDIYDWRKEGQCNRYIARVLNLKTRFRNITEFEIEKAFKKAIADNAPVYMGVDTHDWREISIELEEFWEKFLKVAAKYPEIDYGFAKNTDAFKDVLNLKTDSPIKLKTTIEGNLLTIDVVSGEPFGSQPYLAIKLKSGQYLHDNLDFGEFKKRYYYTFNDSCTMDLKEVDTICLACNDKYGNQDIVRIKL